MRVLIDGMNLALEEGTGVATYARNLSYCIKQNGHHLSVLYGRGVPAYRDPLLREAMFFDGRDRDRSELQYHLDLLRSFLPLTPAKVPETGQVMRDHIADRLPEADAFFNIRSLFFKAAAKFRSFGGVQTVRLAEPVDIAHWTYPVPVRIAGAKNIYTFHDIVPVKLPYTTLDVKKTYLEMLRRLAADADHIVTVSEASRDDIVGALRVGADKVTNTYQSVRIPEALLAESDEQVEIDLDAINPEKGGAGRVRRDEFFLFVGAIEPKKNVKRIIEGYLASGARHPLVIVGRKAWRCDEEMALIKRAGARIIYLDYLPFAQVIRLMRAARAMVFASIYEGFGLPVLEGFICGAPVITSKSICTEEIAGDAALLVDPYDVREIRAAFRKLDDDGSDALRGEMRAKGRVRAAAFAQDMVAERIEAVYRDVLAA